MKKPEIERRFLLDEVPVLTKPEQKYEFAIISQFYSEDGFRYREVYKTENRFSSGWREITWFKTKKENIEGSTFSVMEDESQITEEEYKLATKDKTLPQIHKFRYTYTEDGLKFEIDNIFSARLIVLEIELDSEDQEIKIPDWINYHIVAEITGVKSLSNRSIALTIKEREHERIINRKSQSEI